jgi:uncharacterized delta-60 repeat protein
MPFLSSPRTRLGAMVRAGLLSAALALVPFRALAISPVDDGFNPNPNGIVNAVAIQPDGKILVGGYFTQLNPSLSGNVSAGYIARLNHDGSVDTAFAPAANGVVRSIVLQPNGQILLTGEFTAIKPTGSSSWVTRNYAARLNPDGTLDGTFNPNPNAIIYAVAYQSNGQVLIGGSFTTVQPTGSGSPVARNRIARLNADGTLDAAFNPNADKPVLSFAVQNNGQILVGGGFSTLQPAGALSPTTRSCLARLNSDGSLDTTFDPEANGSVMSIVVQPNGQVLVGGQFTSFTPNGASNPTQADFIARLNTDGSVDNGFIINPLSYVSSIALESDGSVLFGGIFTTVYPAAGTGSLNISYVARANPDGSIDSTFLPTLNQAVNAIGVQSDGSVVLGGYFTSSQGATRHYLARVGHDGSVDGTFAPDLQGAVYTALTLSNGQRILGGTFQSMGGATQSYLARINADGTLDKTWLPSVNGPVYSLALQSDGKVLIGGNFSIVDGISRNYVARINTDGSLDGPFNPNPNGAITFISVLSGGQMLMSGSFSQFQPNGATTATAQGYLARINADGTLDTTYNLSITGAVHGMLTQSDNKVVIYGEFTSILGTGVGYIARLNSDNTLDKSFNPLANLPVFAAALQSDGKIVIGGSFSALEPQTGKTGTPTTVTGPYQTITVPQAGTNATTAIPAQYLARLNTDGTVDTSYFPDPSAPVYTLALQSDGKVVVGGAFTSFAQNGNPTGTLCAYMGRVNTDGSLDTTFAPTFNDVVDSIQANSGGGFLVAGDFTTVQPNGATVTTPATHLALVNADGSLNTTLTGSAISSAYGQVSAGALQPNGQILVGGSFSPFAGSPAYYLAGFTTSGSATGFDAQIDGPVNAIDVLPTGAATGTISNYAVWLESGGALRRSYAATSNGQVLAAVQLANGQVLIGGTFTSFGGVTGANYLVRLNTDGSVDTTFTPSYLNGQVNSIAVQADGRYLIGGNFQDILDSKQISFLARINTDGTLDPSFQPSPNLEVQSIAVQSDGKILVGGYFTSMETATTSSTTVRNYMARINADGSLDTSFNPNFNGNVNNIQLLSGGQMLVGGTFTTVDPNLSTTINDYTGLVRLNSDGTLDTKFNPQPSGPVDTIAIQADGKYIIGGNFSSFQPNVSTSTIAPAIVTTGTLARLNTDGSVDTSFEPHPNGQVYSVALTPSGQILVVGTFTNFEPGTSSYTTARYFLGRLNADGTVDATFDPELNATADVILSLQDGSVFVGGGFTGVNIGGALLVGGNFKTVGGTLSPNLARLNADSTVDATFVANPDGPVYALASQLDGKSLVGGSFAHLGAIARTNIARLGTDGSIDTSFAPSANGAVNALAVQSDGKILAGGAFTAVNGQTASYIVRMSAAGTVDTGFSATLNGPVTSIAVQQGGQVLVGGAFTTADGHAAGGVARLNSDGSYDSSLAITTNGTVYAVTPLNDGSILIGGTFTTVSGTPAAYAARILATGAVDTTFAPAPNGPVHMILVQPDGKITLGGAFTSAGGLSRYELARVASPAPIFDTLTATYDESTITWIRKGPAPVLSAVTFETSTDGSHWTTAGAATAVDANTWQLSGLQPAGGVVYYVRATGVVPTSQNSSSGLIQKVQLIDIFAIPAITSANASSGSLGTPFSFAVAATKSPTFFFAAGLPPGLSINSSSGVISGTPTSAGTYTVTITAGNSSGSTTSTLVITVSATGGTAYTPAPQSMSSRLVDIACRVQMPGSSSLTAGFVVTGSGQKTVLLRAVGPGLSAFSVSNVMATPRLQLFSGTTVIASNQGWGGSTNLSTKFQEVGAFALATNSADAAILTNLAPGAYTIKVDDPTGKGGAVLTEVYDASDSPLSDTTRIINISAQGDVSSGSGVLIGGFVIEGSATKSLLVRGVGPGLTGFGVPSALGDPVLSVYDSNGTLVAQNHAWATQVVAGVYQAAVGAANIINLDASAGAFALSAADTAVIVDLPPGAYTFQVSSASGSTGRALGEVYELQP